MDMSIVTGERRRAESLENVKKWFSLPWSQSGIPVYMYVSLCVCKKINVVCVGGGFNLGLYEGNKRVTVGACNNENSIYSNKVVPSKKIVI